MTKELFVSSTPHETRVGMVEDDQLAEIYLERENEYTLAGSIYKGRVTRVLPGMQSAFVDIGLERDAFLYVSDFMELAEEDEVEDIPASAVQPYQPQKAAPPVDQGEVPEGSAQLSATEGARSATNTPETRPPENRVRSTGGDQRESRGNWRSRRRGRGRRGERVPESRLARPESSPSTSTEYGPPPGYQPIVLPGESISKYQRRAQTQSAQQNQTAGVDASAPISAVFPEDEPLFSKDHQPGAEEMAESQPVRSSADQPHVDQEETHESDEERRFDQMNVASVFAGPGATHGYY
jgi:Ribonuclease G/E